MLMDAGVPCPSTVTYSLSPTAWAMFVTEPSCTRHDVRRSGVCVSYIILRSAQILERSRSLCSRSRNYRYRSRHHMPATSACWHILLHNQGELQGLWRKPQKRHRSDQNYANASNWSTGTSAASTGKLFVTPRSTAPSL